MDTGPLAARPSLIDRAKAIILRPREEWPRIAAEPATTGDILRGYVLPLAAIGPVAAFIGSQVFGYSFLGVTWTPGLMPALLQAIVSYVLTIVGVFVLAYVADWLAPKFAGRSDRTAAFKLVAYGATASWLAQVFYLIPALSFFGILGLYSLYLFYAGVEPVMKVPQDKVLGYTAVTFLGAMVIFILIGFIAGRVIGQPGADSLRDAGELKGTLSLPGVGSVDVGEMERIGKRMEEAASGKIQPLTLDQLKGLLPEKVGAYTRDSVETTALGGVGSSGEATYRAGERSFTLTITDMSTVGALAGLAGAFGVEQNREDAQGYERTGRVDGAMQTEAWNRDTQSGTFGRMVAERFMVQAQGSAASIDELKQAVASVDERELEDLAE